MAFLFLLLLYILVGGDVRDTERQNVINIFKMTECVRIVCRSVTFFFCFLLLAVAAWMLGGWPLIVGYSAYSVRVYIE